MHRVTVTATGVAGGPAYITGYFSETGTAQAAATAWFNFVTPPAAGIPNGCTYAIQQAVPNVDSATGEIFEENNVAAQSLAGTSAGEILPNYVQLLARWKSNQYVNGRRVQGRTSLPYKFETDSDAGRPNVATLNYWTPKVVTLLADPNSTFGIWHRPPPDQPGGGLFCIATAGSIWGEWSMLKSRRS